MATVCEVAFQALFDYMVKSIDAGSVTPGCFSAGLINDQQREECFRESISYKKAELLLGYIKKSVSDEDHGRKNFDTFVAILRKTGNTNQADKLSEAAATPHSTQPSRPQQPPPAEQQSQHLSTSVLPAEVTKGIPAAKLDERLPETGLILAKIVRSLKSWKQLCDYFEITPAEEHVILAEHTNDFNSQKRSFLLKWRQKNYIKGATYRHLMELLYQAGEEDTVLAIKELLK